MKVVGLDLSLTSTGVASVNTDLRTVLTTTIKPGTLRGHERLAWIRRTALAHWSGAHLVVVEGPSYGSTQGQAGHHERAGLWWMVTHQMWELGAHVAIVPPSNLKKYATGKGNAGKDMVLSSAVRRFAEFVGGNDEADALWLAAMGADHLGHPLPVAPMPESHRTALAGVTWPVTP